MNLIISLSWPNVSMRYCPSVLSGAGRRSVSARPKERTGEANGSMTCSSCRTRCVLFSLTLGTAGPSHEALAILGFSDPIPVEECNNLVRRGGVKNAADSAFNQSKNISGSGLTSNVLAISWGSLHASRALSTCYVHIRGTCGKILGV
jgi:hypothetical protein